MTTKVKKKKKIKKKDDAIKDEHLALAIELAVKTAGSLIINDKGSLYLGSMNIWDKAFLETHKSLIS